MLTETTTRQQFIEQIVADHGKTPANAAVARHLTKLRQMSDDEWVAHRARLIEMDRRFAPEAARLAAEVIRRRGR